MTLHRRNCDALMVLLALISLVPTTATAAKVAVDLGDAQGVTLVGAMQRWDQDGNHRKLPDPKATIEAPYVDASAVEEGRGRWVFKDLPKGKYDLVILANGKRRFEGFYYVPIREFDPYFPPNSPPEDETREFIIDDIKKSEHYENIVTPLYMSGDKKAVRVLMMLIRDKPTTFKEVANAATIRHELWQYSWNYGGWQKEKRTKVMDRIILSRDDLRQWTWLWDTKLGGLEVGDNPVSLKYDLPTISSEKTLKGLYPY